MDHFYLPLKSTSEIILKKEVAKRKPKPDGSCDASGDEVKPIRECLESCTLTKLSETCKCHVPFDTENLSKASKNCTWDEVLKCDLQAAYNEVTYEACECRIPCDESVIIASQSETRQQTSGFISKSFISDPLGPNDVEFNLFYPEIRYSEVGEEPNKENFTGVIFDVFLIFVAFTGLSLSGIFEIFIACAYNFCCKRYHNGDTDFPDYSSNKYPGSFTAVLVKKFSYLYENYSNLQ